MKDRSAILEKIRLESLTKSTYEKRKPRLRGNSLNFLGLEGSGRILQENNDRIKV